jgi:two-component system response regulator AtoC
MALGAPPTPALARGPDEAFVAVNCGAVSATLIESELFGHERGSFTGADRQHRGLFERAQRGTLFLDEITEMPIDSQVKLLRVLETRSLQRVGGQQTIAVDARVIAATNRIPREAVQAGKLREDLHYRLNVFPIAVPPLRDRMDDVELLAQHFLAEMNKQEGTSKQFSREALQRLKGYDWPGNVRELKNAVHRAVILSDDVIGVDAVPLGIAEVSGSALDVQVGMSLAEIERHSILATLDHCEGDKKLAAKTLGISLKTLYTRLSEYKPRV